MLTTKKRIETATKTISSTTHLTGTKPMHFSSYGRVV